MKLRLDAVFRGCRKAIALTTGDYTFLHSTELSLIKICRLNSHHNSYSKKPSINVNVFFLYPLQNQPAHPHLEVQLREQFQQHGRLPSQHQQQRQQQHQQQQPGAQQPQHAQQQQYQQQQQQQQQRQHHSQQLQQLQGPSGAG